MTAPTFGPELEAAVKDIAKLEVPATTRGIEATRNRENALRQERAGVPHNLGADS